jgi:hypothetical protein
MTDVTKHCDILDDWKSEYLPRLQKSHIYTSLVNDCNDTDKEVIVSVENAVSFSVQRVKTITKHMGELSSKTTNELFYEH